jgi:hypothetical protein
MRRLTMCAVEKNECAGSFDNKYQMAFYHTISEVKSQVFVLDIHNTEYQIYFHYMEQEGKQMQSYYQSRPLREHEYRELKTELDKQFAEQKVPECISEQFEETVEVIE